MPNLEEIADAISEGFPVIGTDSQGRTLRLRLRPPRTPYGGWCLDIENVPPGERDTFTTVVLDKAMTARLAILLVEAL
jgi:hypothetical protein